MPNELEPIRMCSCPRTVECPFEDVCLDKDLQYTAELSSNLPNYGTKEYKGICSTEWKKRFANHQKSFRHERYETDSELSKEVWCIKRKGGNFSIRWSKDGNYSSYKPETKGCSLCANEKLTIARYEGNNLLNRRNEIISRCRHRLRYKLKNLMFWRQILYDVILSDTTILYVNNGHHCEFFNPLRIVWGITTSRSRNMKLRVRNKVIFHWLHCMSSTWYWALYSSIRKPMATMLFCDIW